MQRPHRLHARGSAELAVRATIAEKKKKKELKTLYSYRQQASSRAGFMKPVLAGRSNPEVELSQISYVRIWRHSS